MISCTEPLVSLKTYKPNFDPSADHALNLCGALEFAEHQFGICSGLAQIPDGRASNCSHPLSNTISSLFTMYMLQYPSIYEFYGPNHDGSDSKTSKVENCCRKIVTGRSGTVKTSPSPSAMYNFVGKLDAEGIRALLYKTIEAAKKLSTLAAGAVDGHFIIPLDGTETHKSKKPLNEKYSQVRDHRNGEREYVHKAVVASLALTTGNLVLDWEMMNGADPTKKGEAEISCAKRLLPRIKEKFPELLDIVTVDALYPNASMVNMARELDFTLVTRIKDSRRKAIRETRERFDSGPENDGTFTGMANASLSPPTG